MVALDVEPSASIIMTDQEGGQSAVVSSQNNQNRSTLRLTLQDSRLPSIVTSSNPDLEAPSASNDASTLAPGLVTSGALGSEGVHVSGAQTFNDPGNVLTLETTNAVVLGSAEAPIVVEDDMPTPMASISSEPVTDVSQKDTDQAEPAAVSIRPWKYWSRCTNFLPNLST